MEREVDCVLSSWIPDQNPMPLSPPIFLRGEGRRQHKALDMTLDDGYSFKSFEAQELKVDYKLFIFGERSREMYLTEQERWQHYRTY